MMLKVVVPGEPFAQPRQRHRLVTTKSGRQFVHNYQPKEAASWKGAAQVHMLAARNAGLGDIPMFTGPVAIVVRAYFTCPKSDFRMRAPRGERPCAKKPDYDNIGKAICDAGTGILWGDDAQIADAHIVKRIAAQGVAPRVELTVWTLEE